MVALCLDLTSENEAEVKDQNTRLVCYSDPYCGTNSRS